MTPEEFEKWAKEMQEADREATESLKRMAELFLKRVGTHTCVSGSCPRTGAGTSDSTGKPSEKPLAPVLPFVQRRSQRAKGPVPDGGQLIPFRRKGESLPEPEPSPDRPPDGDSE